MIERKSARLWIISQSFHPNFFVSTPQLPASSSFYFSLVPPSPYSSMTTTATVIECTSCCLLYMYMFAHKLLVTHFNCSEIPENASNAIFSTEFFANHKIRFRYGYNLLKSQHTIAKKNISSSCMYPGRCDSVRAQESNCVDAICV